MKAIGVCAVKGGTGKTLISLNIAHRLSKNFQVGIIDADFDNSNFAQFTNFQNKLEFSKDHIKLPQWNGVKVFSMSILDRRDRSVSMSGERYVQMLSDLMVQGDWRDVEYVVIDMPSGSSDVFRGVLKIFGYVLLGNIIVTQPLMVDSARRALRLHKYFDIPVIGLIENMAYFQCIEHKNPKIYFPFGKPNGEELAKEFGVEYLGSIPLIPNLWEKIHSGDPIIESEAIDKAVSKIKTLDYPKTSLIERLKEVALEKIKEQVEKVLASIILKTQKELPAKGISEKYGFTDQKPFIVTITNEEGDKSITRIPLKVKDGKLVPISKPDRIDFEICFSPKTFANIVLGRLDPWDAWLNGDIKVYGTGFMSRAVYVLKTLLSDSEFLEDIREKYGSILEVIAK